MATIHPSRMNLIPQDMRSTHTEMNRARSPSPRRPRRSPSPPTRRSRSRDRDRGYPGRRDHQPRYGGPPYGGGGGGGADFLERYEKKKNPDFFVVSIIITCFLSRRAQREARTVNIWPPSPKAPARELYVFWLLLNLVSYTFNSLFAALPNARNLAKRLRGRGLRGRDPL